MKATYKHIAFAALALSAAACSQDDDFAPSYLSDPDAVRITAQVGTNDVTGGFTRSNPLGTAEEQAKFSQGDQIAVTAGTQAAVTYTLDEDGTWTPTGTDYLKWESETMDVTAYYPAGKNDASATTFTVPTGYADPAALADADYMTYSGQQSKGTDNSLNLTMQRKMARLVIDEIDYNNQFKNDKDEVVYSVTGIKVHANSTGYAGGNVATGSITVTAYPHEDGAFYALLAPTTQDDEALFLTVTVSDGTNSQDLTLTGIPPTEAGNSYSFKLTVGKDKLTMGEVKVTPWTEGTAIAVKELFESSINETTQTLTMTVYNATPDETKAVIADALEVGCTTLDITLPADASAEMITAIRRAICDDENVTDGSINLTLKGVTEIPSTVDDEGNDGIAFGPRYEQYDDNGNEIVPNEEVTQLKSVNLPDVTSIGYQAFSCCRSLATITAPKVQTVAERAFEDTALTSVELPKATTIGAMAFQRCDELTSVKFPSATSIGGAAFAVSENITYLELTAEGTITFGNDAVFNDASSGDNFEGNIDLVLHANKQDQVSGNTWTTTHDVLGNVSYTFKSITFVGEEATE